MNLLNLIGATLLAVSPIHEPKNVQIPSDSILQKVEYLDYNIISTSYITTFVDDVIIEHSYTLNITDSKDINFDFYYLVRLNGDNSDVSLSLYDNISGSELIEEFVVSTDLLHDLYQTSNVDDSYLNLTLNEGGAGDLYLEVDMGIPEYSSDSNILSYQSFVLTTYVSEDNISYYNNLLNSSNDDGSLNMLNLDLGNDNIFSYFLNKYLFTIELGPITNGIFDIVGNTVENYLTTITNLFSRVIALFYVDFKLTILGVLMVFTFGVGIVKFGFNLIKDLLRL